MHYKSYNSNRYSLIQGFNVNDARDKLIQPSGQLDNWLKEDPEWKLNIEAFLRYYLKIEAGNVQQILQKDKPVDMFFTRLGMDYPQFSLRKFMAWLEIIGNESLVRRILDILRNIKD